MIIGMVVAVEIDTIIKKHGQFKKQYECGQFDVFEYEIDNHHLFVISSGAGQISAAIATQILISEFKVSMIVNFGVVGALTEGLSLNDTCIVENVVHYDFDTSEADGCEVGRYLDFDSIYIPTTKSLVAKAMTKEPKIKKVICASGDKFIESQTRKKRLGQLYSAQICDMEAAGILITCIRNDIPVIMIKTISDEVTGGSHQFRESFNQSADLCLSITENIIKEIN